MGSEGSKQIVRSIISQLKIKQNASPAYMLYLLEKLFLVLEDVYSVSSAIELQEAIDEIGDKGGTIFITSGIHIVNTTIDIDGGGSYVIYGHGDNTILQPAAGVRLFNVTDSVSVLFRTFKVDTSSYILPTTEAFFVNETNNNLIAFEDITIVGDGTNGVGIELQSDNCIVNNCNITLMAKGVYINNSDNHAINMNTISSHDNRGIDIDTSNNLLISSNKCSSNDYGIYADIMIYSTLSNNICLSNTLTGIYIDGSSNTTISSNICNSNSLNGIYLTGSSYNTVSSNNTNGNDSNSASNTAGIFITAVSSYNTITANSSNNNNNIGAGKGYGVRVDTGNCIENVIRANNANGNDIDYEDEGVGTLIIYYVQTSEEIQNAIDSIGSGAGTIRLTVGTIGLTSTILISGGGDYVIEGYGQGSIIDCDGDRTAFEVSSATSLILRNFKIDASDLTTVAKYIINHSDATCHNTLIENITIEGDGTNGYGIFIESSDYHIINNCIFKSLDRGVHITGCDFSKITNNNFDTLNNYGIYANVGTGMKINDNFFTDSGICMYNSVVWWSHINNNYMESSTKGIEMHNCDRTIVDGNTILYMSGIFFHIENSNFCNIINNTLDTTRKSSAWNDAVDTHYIFYLESDCEYNTFTGNTIPDCWNAGAGISTAIYITNVGNNKNIFKNNQFGYYGVDFDGAQFIDGGDNNQIEYLCTIAEEIQFAIDSIAAKSGTIKILTGTIELSTTIDVDGTGTIIIEGNGAGTIIDCAADRQTFNISSSTSLTLRNFKIDVTDLTAAGTIVINADSGLLVMDGIIITGDGTNGIGVDIASDYAVLNNCFFDSLDKGINIAGTADKTIIHASVRYNASATNDYVDGGTNTKILADDTAYAATWNGDLGTATKNAIYDKIETLSAGVEIGAAFPGAPSDGDLFYDTDDEAVYMWSDDAAAWIQVGGAGRNVDYDKDLMIGAANSGDVPCVIQVRSDGYMNLLYGVWVNVGANDSTITAFLQLPTNRGVKKLYIKGWRVGLDAADSNDYVDGCDLIGVDHNTQTTLGTDTTNLNTPTNPWSYALPAVEDCSGYDSVYLNMSLVCTTFNQLRIQYVVLDCYYDD